MNLLIIQFINIIILSFFWKIFYKDYIFKVILSTSLFLSTIYSVIFISNIKSFDGIIFYLSIPKIYKYLNFFDFIFYIIFFFINFALFFFLIFFWKRFKLKYFTSKIKNKFFLIIVYFLILICSPIVINETLYIYNFKKSETTNDKIFENFLNTTQLIESDEKNYKKKNIIFLNIESLSYEIANDKDVMPFLNYLINNSKSFNNISELDVTNYTTSGMYALLCGSTLPKYNIYQAEECLFDKLIKNKYNISLIRSDPSFFLREGIRYGKNYLEVCDAACLIKNTSAVNDTHIWGVHDHVGFDKLYEDLQVYLNNKMQFAIFFKTIDTHIDGYLSDQCKRFVYQKNYTKIKKVFKCLDYQLEELYKKIENLNITSDLLLIISSDHPSMSLALTNNNELKNTFLIYDFQNREGVTYNKLATKFDIPATILDEIGITNKLNLGVSIYDNNKNLINSVDNLNLYLNKNKFSQNQKINFKAEFIKFLKKNLSEDNYFKFRDIYDSILTKYGVLKFKFLARNFDNKKIKFDDLIKIAHGGGVIDDKINTNSLEAINQSFKDGFKYIELDIQETSDGHYIAAHDWKSWSKMTNFNGELPPTLDQFMKHKIYKKYTPLTIYDIKKWFEERSEITLVTDKVNDPVNFVKFFDLKEQLYMELFDHVSMINAQKLNIKFIISGIYLNKQKRLNNELLTKLKWYKHENQGFIAVSNIAIAKNLNFFIDAKNKFGFDILFYYLNNDYDDIISKQYKFACSFSKLISGGYFEKIKSNEDEICNK
jgi:glycerophosphoryl diester phosphodiesterase